MRGEFVGEGVGEGEREGVGERERVGEREGEGEGEAEVEGRAAQGSFKGLLQSAVLHTTRSRGFGRAIPTIATNDRMSLVPEYRRIGPAVPFKSLHGPSSTEPPGQSNVTAKHTLWGESKTELVDEEEAVAPPKPLKQLISSCASVIFAAAKELHAGGGVTASAPAERARRPLLAHENGAMLENGGPESDPEQSKVLYVLMR